MAKLSLNTALFLLGLAGTLPGIYLVYYVVESWLQSWFPEKWVTDLAVLSIPFLLLGCIAAVNFAKRFSANRKSALFTSLALLFCQWLYYIYLFTKLGLV
jgi:hypothetical protein